MARYDDMNTQNLTVIGICGAVGTFVVIIALQVMYHHYESQEIARKVLSVPQTASESALNEQRSKLASMGWVDRDQQVVAVPIEDAMSQVLAREQRAMIRESANAN